MRYMRRRKRRRRPLAEVRISWSLLGTKPRPLSLRLWRGQHASRSRLSKVRVSSARLLAVSDIMMMVQAGRLPNEITSCLF